MTAFEIGIGDYTYKVRAIPNGVIAELGTAIEALRDARRESVAHTLSLKYANYVGNARAESLVSELKEAGYVLAAAVISRVLAEKGDLEFTVVIRPVDARAAEGVA